MKKKVIIMAMIGVSIILFSCENTSVNGNNETLNEDQLLIEAQEAQIKKLEKENDELLTKLNSTQINLKYAGEQITYFQQFSLDALDYLSDKELVVLAKKQLEYTLEVNGQIMPKDGKIEIQENNIEISLSERQPANNALPVEIYSKGEISGRYEKHMQDFNPNPTVTNWRDGTVVTAIQYQYLEVNSGTTISFSITDELKERLGLDTTQISIVKK
ncbi:hypothetical protein PB01_10300 [Psychrobacillus glaciei]|uniref:Lipoprotein n=1 Tax=Psychrobacillus glaciei TaxID=2283160 RepID=A0A5J6SMF3_9BACI|nr:hypothetical protein [Psychrobacillus glaciei]QFF99190.1 hypothetical protein PB01_10300 [Psychrobacillus glaciei]